MTPQSEFAPSDESASARSCDASLPASVSAVLYEILPNGAANIGTVARRLQHTERSLRRQLQALGTNYRSISNRVRLELTQRYLREGLPVEDVLRMVGFHGRGQFYRAFKRWTGHTPSAANGCTSAATHEHGACCAVTLGPASTEYAPRSC
jgi:AraC-like DNA-binding protein